MKRLLLFLIVLSVNSYSQYDDDFEIDPIKEETPIPDPTEDIYEEEIINQGDL